MEKNLKLAIGGVELLVAIGVSTLVGGALALVKPGKIGPIKKIGVGLAGLAVSTMATDAVVEYVDKQLTTTVEKVKEFFNKKPEEETLEEVEA